MARRERSEGDQTPSEEIGYGRPPHEHRFKPGHKGNPWGCKGKPKPRKDFLQEEVAITFDGEVRKITREQAIDFFLFKKMTSGSVSAARALEERARRRSEGANSGALPEELSAEDKAALDRHIEREAKRLREAETKSKRLRVARKPK